MANELKYLRNQVQHPPPQFPTPRKNPPPPMFSGIPSELSSFKLAHANSSVPTMIPTPTLNLKSSMLASYYLVRHARGTSPSWTGTPFSYPPPTPLTLSFKNSTIFLETASPFKLANAPSWFRVRLVQYQSWQLHFKTLPMLSAHAGLITLSFMSFHRN